MPTSMIKILFVDDEEQFLESMKKRLEARGFHVIAVNRGIKAIEAARKNPVDIALLDLKMPGINGNELIQMLKREHPWIEVIILTGHGGVDDEFESLSGGAYAYLHKPCNLEEILDAISNACKCRLTKKYRIDENRLDSLIEKHNPQGTLLGVFQAMKKIENEVLKTST